MIHGDILNWIDDETRTLRKRSRMVTSEPEGDDEDGASRPGHRPWRFRAPSGGSACPGADPTRPCVCGARAKRQRRILAVAPPLSVIRIDLLPWEEYAAYRARCGLEVEPYLLPDAPRKQRAKTTAAQRQRATRARRYADGLTARGTPRLRRANVSQIAADKCERARIALR